MKMIRNGEPAKMVAVAESTHQRLRELVRSLSYQNGHDLSMDRLIRLLIASYEGKKRLPDQSKNQQRSNTMETITTVVYALGCLLFAAWAAGPRKER